jgi:hypothetical protein
MKTILSITFAAVLLLCSCTAKKNQTSSPQDDSLAKVRAYLDSLDRLKAFYESKPRPYPEPLPDSVKARQLKNGFRTPEALCDAFLSALEKRDTARLYDLTLTRDEYLNWLWVEMPASKPIFNIPLEFVWENNWNNSVKGLNKALYNYGGKRLAFAALEFRAPDDEYQSFKLKMKPLLIAVDSAGNTHKLSYFSAIVEMNGLYKVVNYTDKKITP